MPVSGTFDFAGIACQSGVLKSNLSLLYTAKEFIIVSFSYTAFCIVAMIFKKAVCQLKVDLSVTCILNCGYRCLLFNVYGAYRTEFAVCCLGTDF